MTSKQSVELNIVSWNVLAPTLSGEPDGVSNWPQRSMKICNWLEKQNAHIISLSEIDEFVGQDYHLRYFTNTFPMHRYFFSYAPKGRSVMPSTLSVRHGNLVIVDRSVFRVCGVFTLPMGEKEDTNQIAQILLLHHRATRQNITFVSLHLKAGNGERAHNTRQEQLTRTISLARDHLASRFGYTILLAGDFNQNKLEIDGFMSVFNMCRDTDELPCERTQANSAIASKNKKDSYKNDERLDYMFLNVPNANAQFVELLNLDEQFEYENLSDHIPLSAKVLLKVLPID